jgi:hypothetical protein
MRSGCRISIGFGLKWSGAAGILTNDPMENMAAVTPQNFKF